MSLSPDDVPATMQEAQKRHKAGDPKGAIALYEAALAALPQRADIWYLMAAANCALQRYEHALVAVDRALSLGQAQAAYFLTRGQALHGLQRLSEAVSSFHEAIRLRPEFIEARYSLGMAMHDIGQLQQAMRHFTEVLRVEPRHARASYNLALIEQQSGLKDQAVRHFRQSLEVRPAHADAWYQLGKLLRDEGKLADAASCFGQALNVDADHFNAQLALAMALESMCRLPEAITAYAKAAGLRPGNSSVHNNLGNALVNHCQLREAVDAFQQALKLDPSDARIHSNLLVCLNYDPNITNDATYDEHVKWAQNHALPVAHDGATPANDANPERRLKVGFVSPGMDAGAVQYFLAPLLANISTEAFELFAYLTQAPRQSLNLQFKQLRSRFTKWCDVSHMTPLEAAEQIRADSIDILVDLSGHTPGHGLLTFALKPAPVQVTWLDYFNTTGLSAMDYLVSDATHTPEIFGQKFTEQLVRLPHSRLCYAPPAYAPAVAAAPSQRNRHITFGCFNRLSKLTPQAIALWSKLLQAIPDARLILKSNSLNDPSSWPECHGWFQQHGIDPARIELRPASPHPQMLAEYGDIDIALDPFPYNGGLTTCEALWMGVPVIALLGDRMIARQSAALLTAAGLKQFIANDRTQYIDIAKAWAADPVRLAQLRKTLRTQIASSPLCDGKQFAHDMEHLYRTIWKKWCADMLSNNSQHP